MQQYDALYNTNALPSPLIRPRLFASLVLQRHSGLVTKNQFFNLLTDQRSAGYSFHFLPPVSAFFVRGYSECKKYQIQMNITFIILYRTLSEPQTKVQTRTSNPNLGRTSTEPQPNFGRTSTKLRPSIGQTSSEPKPDLDWTSSEPWPSLNKASTKPRPNLHQTLTKPNVK